MRVEFGFKSRIQQGGKKPIGVSEEVRQLQFVIQLLKTMNIQVQLPPLK